MTRLITEDIAPTLTPPPGVRVEDYGQQVLTRFANPAIEHRTLQVAMDGSQKLPQRLLGTIADRRRQGGSAHLLALSVAAWMRFAGGVADDGRPLPLDDPMALRILAAVSPEPTLTVRSMLDLFDLPLSDDGELVRTIADWLRALSSAGAAAVVRGLG